MTAKKLYLGIRPGIPVLRILMGAAFVLLVGWISPCQANGYAIIAAPGDLIEEHVVIGSSEAELRISITPPEFDDSLWVLNPSMNPNTRECITPLIINANSNWILTASVDPPNGRAAYGDTSLTETMKMIGGGYLNGESWDLSELVAFDVLATGNGGEGDVVIPLTFEQTVTENDLPLPDDHSYQIIMTFTVTHGMLG